MFICFLVFTALPCIHPQRLEFFVLIDAGIDYHTPLFHLWPTSTNLIACGIRMILLMQSGADSFAG